MKDRLPVPGPRFGALIELLRTAETLWNASRVFFAKWDLSPSQFNILNVLCDQPDGCSQIELSRELIMHRSNVTGLVDRLEARSLVRRTENPDDRRAFNVVLTPAGWKLIREILPHFYQAAETVWDATPVKRADQLVAELQTLGANAARIGARPESSSSARS